MSGYAVYRTVAGTRDAFPVVEGVCQATAQAAAAKLNRDRDVLRPVVFVVVDTDEEGGT